MKINYSTTLDSTAAILPFVSGKYIDETPFPVIRFTNSEWLKTTCLNQWLRTWVVQLHRKIQSYAEYESLGVL
jgi:F420-0:gamma-glutamyl ligase